MLQDSRNEDISTQGKGHANGSQDIQNGWILSGQPAYIWCELHSGVRSLINRRQWSTFLYYGSIYYQCIYGFISV